MPLKKHEILDKTLIDRVSNSACKKIETYTKTFCVFCSRIFKICIETNKNKNKKIISKVLGISQTTISNNSTLNRRS